MITQHYGWVFLLIPLVAVVVLAFLRPKTPAADSTKTGLSATKPIVDLGAVALTEVLRRLDEAITVLDKVTGDRTDSTQSVVVLARSALTALQQSTVWRGSMDPLIAKSVNENLLDALRMMPVSTPEWEMLKAELDKFQALVSANFRAVATDAAVPSPPAGSPGSGGSTPPAPVAVP